MLQNYSSYFFLYKTYSYLVSKFQQAHNLGARNRATIFILSSKTSAVVTWELNNIIVWMHVIATIVPTVTEQLMLPGLARYVNV